MKKINLKTALQNRSIGKPYSIWSEPDSSSDKNGYESVEVGNGGQRIFIDRIKLDFKSKFRINLNSSIFTSGSCFAREIAVNLKNQGLNVTSELLDGNISPSVLNRYNTFSIINDYQFASGRSFDEKNIAHISGERYADYSGYGIGTRDALLTDRLKVIDLHKNALSSDIVVVTLGLVESWFDLKTNTYLNITPYELFRSSPDRFELRITDYSENYNAVSDFITWLKSLNPNVKFILTVSPVPLNATFSGFDVITANTYSKSVLRSVAQDIASKFEFVDYFPSYEMVMFSAPETSWLPDRRHVRREHVEYIVSQFVEHYVS